MKSVKILLVIGIVILSFASYQYLFLRRGCHYVPKFDDFDGVTFGLAYILLAIGLIRYFRIKHIVKE